MARGATVTVDARPAGGVWAERDAWKDSYKRASRDVDRLRALLERARDRVEWVAENFPDDRGSRAYALLAEIDAALRREG